MSDRSPNQPSTPLEARSSRTLLGALLGVLVLAVLLALWLLITQNNDETASEEPAPLPTPVAVPTPTALPVAPTVEPTATVEPTPVPEGFEACDATRSPLTSATYIVDTIDTPLNQRLEPRIDGELVGTFTPGQTGLVFNGECLVNLADGFVWWQINNGSQNVWVASDFVTPN